MSSNMVAASSTIEATQQISSKSQSDDSSSESSGAPSSLTADEEASQIREKITNDLKSWQEKFAKAADKGTEDLEERVKEITDHQIASQVHGVGEALVIQLEDLAYSELSNVRRALIDASKSISEDSSDADIENAERGVSEAVRSAGQNIKSKAQAIRSWKQDYKQETDSLVTAASDSTLEVIDNIRDLGLQEIGMRWAWMEGVTYKDWSKYHALKKTFDEWRVEVEQVAKEHPGLEKSRIAAEAIESKGMSIAENTARELARLKEAGKIQIEVRDRAKAFSKVIPANVAAAGQKIMDKIDITNEKSAATFQDGVESAASHASQLAEDALSAASSRMAGPKPGIVQQAVEKMSETVIGTSTAIHESLASQASRNFDSVLSGISEVVSGSAKPTEGISASASSVVSQASKRVFAGAMAQEVREQVPIFDDIIDDEDETYSQKLQSIVSQAGDKYADITKAVSEAMFEPTPAPGSAESITSVASDRYLSALEAASSILYGTPRGTVESISSVASSKYADAVAM